jgi:hypothetical protein
MARLFAMASFEGIANLLATDQGVEFGTLTMPFSYRQGVLEIQDGHAEGSQIGITLTGRLDVRRDIADLRGTVVPLYMLNSIVGKIPLLGEAIVGEKNSGLFAARFSVQGDLAKPDFTVNPLSMLTPGPFRRLFDQSGFRVRQMRGIPGPFALAFGDSRLSRALFAINAALVRLSRGLFSYQMFFVVEQQPSLEYLLERAFEYSEERTTF